MIRGGWIGQIGLEPIKFWPAAKSSITVRFKLCEKTRNH